MTMEAQPGERKEWIRGGLTLAVIVLAMVVKARGWRGELIFPPLYVTFRLYEDWYAVRLGLARTLMHAAFGALLGVAVFYLL